MKPASHAKSNFIPLANLHLCNFSLRYKILPKGQLEFQSLRHLMQHYNLMLVDSIFPEVLSDAALYVRVTSDCTVEQVIQYLAARWHFDKELAERYYRTKFHQLFELIFFSNISGSELCKGEIDNSKVYCLKNASGNLEYFSLYEDFQLYSLAIKNAVCCVKTERQPIDPDKVQGTKLLEFSMRFNAQPK